jgi:hypothetical protein
VSIRAFLRAPIVYARAWIATAEDPLYMSAEKRGRTIQLIEKLTGRQGWDSSNSERCGFSKLSAEEVPEVSGVYRFFAADELKYVGKSNNLRRRLTEHLRRRSNEGLAELVASGNASVEWRICLMPGWMECYELTKYYETHGRLPEFNSKRGGALWD